MPSFQDRSSRQLNLEELYQFKWILGGAMALLSLWTVARLDVDLGWVPLISLLIVVLAMVYSALPGKLPSIVWKFGTFLIVAVFFSDLVRGEIIRALVRLDLLLILYRTVQYRRKREDLQLIVLCLFVTVVAGVLTVSLFFAAQILFFTACAMCFLFVVNLIETVESGGQKVGRRWTRIPIHRFVRRLSEVFDLRLAGFAGLLFLTVVVISTVLFLSIPRFQIQTPISFLDFRQDQTLTGFSENINLGEVTEIMQDNRIAMRVDVSPADAIPMIPYWRMVVLDEYTHGSFRISNTINTEVGMKSVPTREIHAGWDLSERYSVKGTGDSVRWVFYLEGGVSRFLPLIGNFDRLVFKEPQDLVVNEHFRIFSTAKQSPLLTSFQVEGMDTSGRIPDPELAHYDYSDERPAPLRNLGPPPPVGRRSMRYPYTLLTTPEGEENDATLDRAVGEITDGASLNAVDFSRRAVAWLRARHHYSLTVHLPPDLNDRDPVVRWLESDLAGHCEFFAAGFILLSRRAGFPARAVTGFKGGSWNAYEAYYMIRNSDAHAWCEVLGGDGVWFRVDPTPGASGGVLGDLAVAAPVRLPVDTSLDAYVDSLRMLWYRRIVSFDESSQDAVLKGVRNFSKDTLVGMWAATEAAAMDLVKWLRSPWNWRRYASIALMAGLFILGVVGLRRLDLGWRDMRQILRRRMEPARLRAGQHLKRLSGQSESRPDGAHHELMGDLQRIRYGLRASWPNTREVFQRARRTHD